MVAATDGMKATVKVHLALAAKVVPQGFEPPLATWKLPEAVTPRLLMTVDPVLVTVTVLARLVLANTVFAKTRLAGEKVNGELTPPVPLPDNVTCCGLKLLPYVTVSAPLMLPFTVGAKVTAIVHFA